MDISWETWGFQPTDSHRSTRYLRGENRSPEWTPMPLWPRSCCKSSLGALVQWPGLDWYFLGISSNIIDIIYIHDIRGPSFIEAWNLRLSPGTITTVLTPYNRWSAFGRWSMLSMPRFYGSVPEPDDTDERSLAQTGGALFPPRGLKRVSTNNFRRPNMWLYGHGSKLSSPKMDRWIQEMTSFFRGSILGRLVTADPRLEVPKPAQVRSPRRPPRLRLE